MLVNLNLAAKGVRQWTPDEDEVLKERWEKMSASEIAKLLPGRTRNSVIGRANRLGLANKTNHADRPPYNANAARRARREKQRLEQAAMAVPKVHVRKGAVPPKRFPDPVPLTDKAPIGIMELRRNTCRAVVGKGRDGLAVYCGDQTFPGKSFCEGHCAMYYTYKDARRA